MLQMIRCVMKRLLLSLPTLVSLPVHHLSCGMAQKLCRNCSAGTLLRMSAKMCNTFWRAQPICGMRFTGTSLIPLTPESGVSAQYWTRTCTAPSGYWICVNNKLKVRSKTKCCKELLQESCRAQQPSLVSAGSRQRQFIESQNHRLSWDRKDHEGHRRTAPCFAQDNFKNHAWELLGLC